MRKIRTLIFAGIFLMTGAMSAVAQKNNELTDSYNYKRGVELISADTPDSKGAPESFEKEISEHPKNGYAFFYMGAIYTSDSINAIARKDNQKAPLLLGQSILARLGTIEIDNTKEVIRIKHF